MKKYLTVGFFTLVQGVLQIITLVVLTRLLEPDDVGFYAITTLIASISRLGLSGILPAILTANNDETFYTASVTMFLACMASLILCILGVSYFTVAGFNYDEYIFCFAYALILFFIQSVSMPYEALMLKDNQQAYLVVYEFKNYLSVILPMSILLAYLSFGMHALLFPQMLSAALRYSALKNKIGYELKLKFDASKIKSMLSLNFASVLNYFSTQGDKFYISMFHPLDMLGVYSRGAQVFQFAASIYSKLVGYISFPEFSAEKNTSKRRAGFIRSFELSYIMSMGVGMFFWWPSELLLAFLFGEKWRFAAEIASIFVIFMAPRLTYKLSDYFIMATSTVRVVVLFQLLYATLTFIALFWAHYLGVKYQIIAVFICVSVSGYSLIVSLYTLKIVSSEVRQYVLCLYGFFLCLGVFSLTVYFEKYYAYLLGILMFFPFLIFFRRDKYE